MMLINCEIDDRGRLASVTAFPLDEDKQIVDFSDADWERLQQGGALPEDFLLQDGRITYSPLQRESVEEILRKIDEEKRQLESASAIAFVALAQLAQLDEITITEHPSLFADWQDTAPYSVGTIIRYDGKLFRCIQAHTTQSDWTPEKVPALWQKIGDPNEEYPEWTQYIGGGDLYMKDAKVTHKGTRWISTIDNNVWEPGAPGISLWTQVV